MGENSTILTVNVGSSSLKVSLFPPEGAPPFGGSFQKIGTDSCEWNLRTREGDPITGQGRIESASGTLDILDDWITKSGLTISAISHRIVHGGSKLTEHCFATDKNLAILAEQKPLAPEHVPAELAVLEGFRAKFSGVPHVLCFDTVFHRTLPEAAFTYALPRRVIEAGVRRYGFHGLSYEYLAGWLRERNEIQGRSILAHLGNGASMAAALDGQCIDTTMGFTPAAGLVMGTRCGDMDPGIVRYLSAELGMDALSIDRMVNHESGMTGISGVSGDVRELDRRKGAEPRAALALEIFTRAAKKHLCALAGVLGGIDRVVFTGGIGEHAPAIRQQILAGLEFLGLRLDPAANEKNGPLISVSGATPRIFVVPANEEASMNAIARTLLSQPNAHHTQ